MIIQLRDIAFTRSGDKGRNSNIGVIFKNRTIYNWAKQHLTSKIVKEHLEYIIKGNVERYELDNLNAFNFILYDSLGGGGSDSLINDAQGKTHGQKLLLLKVDIPENLKEYI